MAQRTLTQNAQSPYVRWEVPGLPTVIFRRGVVDAIDTEVMRAFNAVPKRGAEVGGILLGSRSETEVLVDDFEPVPCEHRFGPSYQLSNADSAALEETLVHFRTERSHVVSVVGFYRSHTRPDFSLSPEDIKLFTERFADPAQVFLLIKPNRSQQSVADFFFWRDKEVRQALHVVPFPFQESATPPPRRFAPGPEAAPAVAAPIAAPTVAAPEAPALRDVPEPPPKPRVTKAPEPPPALRDVPEPPPKPRVAKPTEPPPVVATPTPAVAAPRAAEKPAQPVAPPRLPPKPIGTAWPYDEARRPRNYWLWGTVAAVLAILGGALEYRSVHDAPAAGPTRAPSQQETAANPTAPPEQTPAQPKPESPAPARAEAPTPAAAPPPTESNTGAREASAQDVVRVMLERWAAAIRQGDVASASHYYAPHMTTYLGNSHARPTDVRGHLEYLRGRYGKLAINRISNLNIRPEGRDTAAVEFRRHWQTTGHRMTTGDTRVRMTLVRTKSGWRIAAEQESPL